MLILRNMLEYIELNVENNIILHITVISSIKLYFD
jgi:hypothetical protein